MSSRQPALWFAVFVVFIDALGMSIIIPILPDLLKELTGQEVADVAFLGGALAAVYALNQFLFGPIVGALSDRFGRRPVILVALFMLMLDYILMAVSWTIWLLFLGRFLAGLSGASYTVASAYIADISSKEKRSANFGLIGAAFGIGFVVGPALGGFAAEFGTRAPLWLAAGISGVGVLFGLFILPESLPTEKRRAFSLRNANPFSSLLRAFAMPAVGLFLLADVLITLAEYTYPAIWSFWGQAAFGWDPRMIGISLAAYGVATVVVQGGLIRAIIPAFGEARTIWFGMAAAIVAYVAFGFANATWIVFAIIPVAALAHLSGAALTGLMSNLVSDSEQGELQGVLGAIGAITSIMSSLVMTALFARVADPEGAIYLPGAPFLLAALLAVVALVPIALALSRQQSVAASRAALDEDGA